MKKTPPMAMNIKPAQACFGFSMRVFTTKNVEIMINMAGVTG
jgi:hypothetical protein